MRHCTVCRKPITDPLARKGGALRCSEECRLRHKRAYDQARYQTRYRAYYEATQERQNARSRAYYAANRARLLDMKAARYQARKNAWEKRKWMLCRWIVEAARRGLGTDYRRAAEPLLPCLSY